MRGILFLTLVVCFHCGKYSSFYTLFMCVCVGGGGIYSFEIKNPSFLFAMLVSLKRFFLNFRYFDLLLCQDMDYLGTVYRFWNV